MKKPLVSKKVLLWIVASISSLLILVSLGFYIVVFVLTPSHIRDPKPEHLHFRMQLIIENNYVNFGEDKYQEPYTPGACSFDITETPIHFHDGKDQIVHIHWKNITGGQVLKYYGIDLVENPLMTSTLGFSFEDKNQIIPKNNKIWGRLFGDTEKKIKSGDLKMFIYRGEKDNFTKKNNDDFLNKNLEDFFETRSLVSYHKTPNINILNLFSLQAEAHGGVKIPSPKPKVAENTTNTDENNSITSKDKTEEFTEEELKEINNLIGNVVIFIQKEEPTNDQVKARFDNLVPLEPSVCGG